MKITKYHNRPGVQYQTKRYSVAVGFFKPKWFTKKKYFYFRFVKVQGESHNLDYTTWEITLIGLTISGTNSKTFTL